MRSSKLRAAAAWATGGPRGNLSGARNQRQANAGVRSRQARVPTPRERKSADPGKERQLASMNLLAARQCSSELGTLRRLHPIYCDDRCTLIPSAWASLSADSTRSYSRRLDAISRTERLWRRSLQRPSSAIRPSKERSLEHGAAAGTLLTGLHGGPHLCYRLRRQEPAHHLPRPPQR